MDIQQIKEQLQAISQIDHFKVYALAALGAVVAAYNSIRHESKESKRIPLAFSEIEQIAEDARTENHEVGDITRFLTAVNDACMQIFESFNGSHDPRYESLVAGFAKELTQHRSRSSRRDSLNDLLRSSAEYAKKVKGKISEHISVAEKLREIDQNFEAAWSEQHSDNYRTEFYTTTDAKGNTTHHTRQVYDDTTHTYEFDKEAGDLAARNLAALLKSVPALKYLERIAPATKISKEGIEAAKKSRGNVELTDEELQKIKDTWHAGTIHDDDLEDVIEKYQALNTQRGEWDAAKETAEPHYHYNTGSSSDAGPKEYQVAKGAQKLCADVAGKVGSFVNSLDLVLEKAPELERNIERYSLLVSMISNGFVNGEGKTSRKDAKKLMKNILSDAKELYTTIFSQGIDTDRFKEEHVALWTLLGGAVGSGLGFLTEYLIDRYHLLQ